MTARTRFIKAVSLYALAVILTAVAWFGVISLRASLVDRCGYTCQTFANTERHDPYCIIDPVCISPLYKPTWTRAGTDPQFMPHWEGLAWLGESGTYGIGLRMLAIPNYVLFMLLLCAIAASIEWRVPQTRLRRLLLTAITTWLTLEVLRWFAVISSADPTVSFVNWELFVVLTLSLSTLWATAVGTSAISRRRLSQS